MQVFTSRDGRLTVLSLQATLGDMWEFWNPHGCHTLTSNVKNAHAKIHICNILGLSVWKIFIFCPQIVKSELFMLTESNIIVATGQKCANDSMEPRQSTGSSRIFFSKFDCKYVYSIKEKRDENQLILYISSSLPDSPSQVKRLVNNKLFSW